MFTEEELARFEKNEITIGEIRYLEKRIGNAKTEKELKFWKKMVEIFAVPTVDAYDLLRIYQDDIVDWLLDRKAIFTLYVEGTEDYVTEVPLDELMTTELNFNGTTMNLEHYLDEVVHWDYDSKWEE